MNPALQSICAWVTVTVLFVLVTAPVLPKGTLTTARGLFALVLLASMATVPLALTLYMYLSRGGTL